MYISILGSRWSWRHSIRIYAVIDLRLPPFIFFISFKALSVILTHTHRPQKCYICFDFFCYYFSLLNLRFAEYFQIIDFTYIGIPQKTTYLQWKEKGERQNYYCNMRIYFIFVNENFIVCVCVCFQQKKQKKQTQMEHVCTFKAKKARKRKKWEWIYIASKYLSSFQHIFRYHLVLRKVHSFTFSYGNEKVEARERERKFQMEKLVTRS